MSEQPGLFDEDYPDYLYNGKPPFEAGSDTSRQAAEAIRIPSGKMRQRIAALFVDGPKTIEEIEHLTGYRHQSAGPRVRELVQAGVLEDTGTTRPTASGRGATVWRIRQAAKK